MATVEATIHHGHAHSTPQKKYSGIRDWLTTIDHKKIGILYFVTAFIFMIFGGLEALMIRIQLSRPENAFVSAETYNQLFTMHGTTMVFMVGMPIAVALFNYIVPLQIGARDVAFPRLNALSYWVFLFAALFMNFSWFLGMAPNGGWFGYANLTAKQYSPGPNIDFWALGLQAMGAASIMGGVNFITTIINLRAPGMKLMRMPLFTWMAFITSALLVTALPVFAVALFELTFDRAWGTNFFNVNAGGDPIVWQHLFWMFGHPEVYILILPGFGIVSEVIPTFSRKPLFGYAVMVYSAALIGLIGWGVWSHHMFAVGLGPIADAFFTVSTMIIAIPTGVKVFNWVATMWGGKIKFTTAMMFSVSFVALFTIGGISGMMHATSPHDLQQTDTYFVVAHFHYVLIGGLINGVFAGIFYWFPKVTGRMMNETLGKAFFWVFFVGMNLTFMPMHWTGLLGMPRRVFTYSPDLGVTHLNQLSTLGGGIQAIGFLLLIANILYSLKRGPKAPNNPWNAATLEWATTSPPVEYNFARIPTITTREPLWLEREQVEAAAFGTPEPMHMPPPSYWPILTAACVMITLMGFMVHVWWAPLIGLVLTMLMVINWAFEPVH